MSDSPSSGSSSEATIVPTPEDTEPTEETSPETSGQEWPNWISPEATEFRSIFADHPQGAFTNVGEPGDWKVHFPTEDDRVCSDFSSECFCVYEFLFKDLGLRLPFSEFQMAVLCHLDLAPTQLHPNSFAFIRAFELTCEYLEIGVTLPLFFHVFHIQRQRTVEGKFGWVSLKQVKKMFKAFSESIRTFKGRYYIVEPISDRAKESVYTWAIDRDERGVPILNEHGRMVNRRFMKFRFSWSNEHFHRNTEEYATNPTVMSKEDVEGFQILSRYVDNFTPAQRENRAKELVFEDDGTPALVPRYINIAQLLTCSSHQEAMELLGISFNARYSMII